MRTSTTRCWRWRGLGLLASHICGVVVLPLPALSLQKSRPFKSSTFVAGLDDPTGNGNLTQGTPRAHTSTAQCQPNSPPSLVREPLPGISDPWPTGQLAAACPRVCELRCGGLDEPLARYHVSLGIGLSLPLLLVTSLP